MDYVTHVTHVHVTVDFIIDGNETKGIPTVQPSNKHTNNSNHCEVLVALIYPSPGPNWPIAGLTRVRKVHTAMSQQRTL